jgi:hypothetical protein
MKKNIKIKLGGGKVKLGGLILNDFHGWDGPQDEITWRELSKSPARIARKVLSEIYGISDYSNWSLFGVRDLDKTAYDTDQPEERIEIQYKPLDMFHTGYYQLSHSGDTTRKIKHYIKTKDLQQIINEDLTSQFKVSNISLGDSSFGPFQFESTSNGGVEYIQITQDTTPTSISGMITGYTGSATSPSVQTLYMEVPNHDVNYNIKFSDLKENTDYYYKYTHSEKSLDGGKLNVSGSKYIKFNTAGATSYNAAVSVSTATDLSGLASNIISIPTAVNLTKQKKKVIDSIDYKYKTTNTVLVDDADLALVVTGLTTGERYDILLQEAYNYNSYNLNEDGSSYDSRYSFLGGPTYFTGSPHNSFDEINITNCTSLNLVKVGNRYKDYRKINFSGCSNLTGFHVVPSRTVTGINLHGCNVKNFNKMATFLPSGSGMLGAYMGFPSLKRLDFYNNDLNKFGCEIILEQISGTQSSTKSDISGYIDIRNQKNFNNLDLYDSITGKIGYLSGRGWEVLYDR